MPKRKPMTEEEAQEAALAMTKERNNVVRRRPDKTANTAPGDNTRYTAHNLKLFRLEPIVMDDNTSVDAVVERTERYFEICQEDDMKPSVAGYALALGIDRRMLWSIAYGRVVKPKAIVDILKRAYDLLNAQMEDYMQNGKINPVSGIFLMKNAWGYQDKQEITVAARQDGTESPDQLAARYADAIPVDYTVNDDPEGAEST